MMNILQSLTVHTSSHDYPIFIGDGAVDLATPILPFIGGKQVMVVSNDVVAPLYLQNLVQTLSKQGFVVATCILPDGEVHKTQASIDRIYDALMSHHFARDCTLIALGGGVIGDMVGFAAASFMRGVDFIQIPTTLLAQVDSSVGGKTGINHRLGKNMIGAFWQPVCVLANMSTFDTLPAREFSAGLAEVVKYALIFDAQFLTWLEDNSQKILAKDGDVLSQMVYKCCDYKANIVASDEKEAGNRALLNFGHTFGHVIETHQGYGNWLHGEAVSAGMMQAMALSCELGWITRADVARVARLLTTFGLPIAPPSIDPKVALDLMGHDKKVKAGQIRLILLKSLGKACVSAEFDDKALSRVLASIDDYLSLV